MRAELAGSTLPLFGRARELAAISAALDVARGGSGNLVCILGDAGIGKTRLAVEAMRMARTMGFVCAWGAGWSEGGSPPLWPWPSIVEQLGDIDSSRPSDVPADPTDLDAERFAQFRTVTRVIARAARSSPVLIVLDNAQAADAGALLLARFAIRSLPAAPVLFVVTARPEPGHATGVGAAIADIARDGVVLRPAPLSVGALREMLHEVGWNTSDRRTDDVHRLTGGVPLLVNELVNSSETGEPIAALEVRAIMELRTRQLEVPQQRIVRVVAILGALAQLPMIAKVSGVDHTTARQALAAGTAAGLIICDDSGCHAFVHDLMADAVLAACSPIERAQLHQAAADWFSTGATPTVEHAGAAAHHQLALAGLRGDVDSVLAAGRSCRRAAALLVERLAYEAAARLLAQSIELHDQAGVPVGVDLLLDVARAELAAGRLRAARAWFWRAAEHADSPPRLAEAAVGLGGIWVDEHRSAIDHAAFMALIDRALSGLVAERPDLRARLEVRRAAELAYLGRSSAASVVEAVERARAIGDPLVLAEALSLQLHTMLGPGARADREVLAEELVTVATEAGDEVLVVMGVLWRTVHRILTGDPRAERSLNELRERADALQIAAVLFVVSAIDVMRLLRRGMIVEAELAVQQCFELGTDIGDADAVGYYGAQLMTICWLRSDPLEILPLARDVANSPTLVEGDVTYPAAVAALAAMAGEPEEARRNVQHVMASPALAASSTSSNWMIWMFCLIEAASALDDADTARSVHAMLVPFRDQPLLGSLGVACFGSAERSLGVAARTFGDGDLAIDHFERSVQHNERLGNLALAAISTGDLGCALIRRGTGDDRMRGRVLIESAINRLTEMGLRRRVEDLRMFADANSSEPVGHLDISDGSWRLRFGDEQVVLAESIGVRRLVQLLERPFVDIPVADLVGGLDQSTRQELMDSVALRSYRDRINELRADIEEADDDNDFIRAERFRTELDTLLEHIAASAALGQRSRQFTNSHERARVAVRKSLSRAFDEINMQSPRFATLLSQCIRTGSVCRFEPIDPLPAVWQQARSN